MTHPCGIIDEWWWLCNQKQLHFPDENEISHTKFHLLSSLIDEICRQTWLPHMYSLYRLWAKKTELIISINFIHSYKIPEVFHENYKVVYWNMQPTLPPSLIQFCTCIIKLIWCWITSAADTATLHNLQSPDHWNWLKSKYCLTLIFSVFLVI